MINLDFNFVEISDPLQDKTIFNFGGDELYYNILKGQSSIFNSIWCDENSGLNNGKFYISTNDSFMVINLNQQKVEDYYTTTIAGRSEDNLKASDIVDITVAR